MGAGLIVAVITLMVIIIYALGIQSSLLPLGKIIHVFTGTYPALGKYTSKSDLCVQKMDLSFVILQSTVQSTEHQAEHRAQYRAQHRAQN